MGRCENSGLEDIRIEPEYVRNMGQSSKGTQLKFRKENMWYKQNQNGYEGKAEYLCSLLLSYTNIKEWVVYQECRINGRNGCMSHNFLQDGEECVSLQRLYEYHYGGQLYEKIRKFDAVEERIFFILNFVKKITKLDITNYLSQLLVLDMVTLNIDRHFHNICLIRNAKGAYRTAPVFDNGAALFSNYGIFPVENTLEENIRRAAAAPFSGSFEKQAAVLGMNLSIKKEIWGRLETEPDCRGKQVLCHQLKRYEFLIGQENGQE